VAVNRAIERFWAWSPKLEGISRACSDGVLIPIQAGCCGFAGDRGFLFPELTASAIRREAAEVLAGQHEWLTNEECAGIDYPVSRDSQCRKETE